MAPVLTAITNIFVNVRLAILILYVKQTSMNAAPIRAKMEAIVRIKSIPTNVAVKLVIPVQIVKLILMNANHRHVSTVTGLILKLYNLMTMKIPTYNDNMIKITKYVS